MRYILIGVLAAVNTFYVDAATSDKEIIAITILAEARGEGESGMYAVAAVLAQRTFNRQLSSRLVCLQSRVVKGRRIHQFSCWNSGRDRKGTKSFHELKSLLDEPQAKYALRLGECLANNIKGIDRSYVGYADHYHNKTVNPYWANKTKKIKTINNHIFYKLR
jgi:spore germination cell wall hydrolase CwlJ-like protein